MFTEKDWQRLENLLDVKIDAKFDEFAMMIKNALDEIDAKFELVYAKIDAINARMEASMALHESHEGRFVHVEHDVSLLKKVIRT